MSRSYNDPLGGSPSSVGAQLRTDYIQKKALIEATREQYFSPLADTSVMPKHFGKKLKAHHYMPLLDDRNINDQGLDAAGAVLEAGKWSAIDALGQIISSGHADKATALAVGGAETAVQDGGNLYGSSKDIGAITGKLPTLGEHGGRKNRVGFTRLNIEGTFEKFGFFDEYTEDSVNFDTDAELMMHINREMLRGASDVTEAALQSDLLHSAGIEWFAGDATANSEVSGETGGTVVDVVTYSDFVKLAIELDNNRCPKHTKMITGSRMIDTRVIDGARIMYVGSEMIPTLKKMKDYFNNPAFIPVQQYAAAGNVLRGEIGTIDQFRIVVVPEMQAWFGRGAAVTDNAGYRETNDKYDVYPLLVVGDGSFTTVGFQTDGSMVKFKIYHKAPGEKTADRNDPYGETGFMSIKWWYGFMLLRPERLALLKSLAEM